MRGKRSIVVSILSATIALWLIIKTNFQPDKEPLFLLQNKPSKLNKVDIYSSNENKNHVKNPFQSKTDFEEIVKPNDKVTPIEVEATLQNVRNSSKTESKDDKRLTFQSSQNHSFHELKQIQEDKMLEDSVFDKKFPVLHRKKLRIYTPYQELLNSGVSIELTNEVRNILKSDLQEHPELDVKLEFVICSAMVCLIEYERLKRQRGTPYKIQARLLKKLKRKSTQYFIMPNYYQRISDTKNEYNTLFLRFRE